MLTSHMLLQSLVAPEWLFITAIRTRQVKGESVGTCDHVTEGVLTRGSQRGAIRSPLPCAYLLEEADSGHRDPLVIAHMPALT